MPDMNLYKGNMKIAELDDNIHTYIKKLPDKFNVLFKKYYRFSETTSFIFWSVNPDENVITNMMTWRTVFTRKGFDAIKKEDNKNKWLRAVHPEDRIQTTLLLFKAVQSECPFEISFRLQKNGGYYQRNVVRGFPICSKESHVREWVGMIEIKAS